MPKYNYILPSETQATTLVVEMSRIINDRGYITVGELHDLLGLSHTAVDARNGWRTTNHVIHPAEGGSVEIEFPNPVSIYTPPARRTTLRLTMEFEATPEIEQRLTDFLNATDLRKDAILWSLNMRPSGPRYRSPYNSGDDL
jgi:hypothetical protein